MSWAFRLWWRLRASFWFIPALVVLASMAAGVALVEVDARQTIDLAQWSPRLFGAGAEGSRAMLSAIATSMVTVAGVVFSITIVTLSLTSTQYSPRVLRNFMRDMPTQVVLGAFVGVFAYCLVVLRTIRGDGEIAFIPSLAVLGGIAYAFVGIGVLIFYIHHVALSIQASSILERIAEETASAIDHLFPQELGGAPPEQRQAERLPLTWTPIRATRSGYVQSVDAQVLLDVAGKLGRVLRLRVLVGDFVAEHGAVADIGGEPAPRDEDVQHVRACVVLGRQRTVEQDAAFGLRQLVDVALRALSPGVNDPTTACMALDQLSWLLGRLACRAMPEPLRFEDHELRVIARAPVFGDLLSGALLPIIRHARGDEDVLATVLGTIETVSAAASAPDRRLAVRQIGAELQAELARIRPRRHSRTLRRRLAAVMADLARDGRRGEEGDRETSKLGRSGSASTARQVRARRR